MIASEIKWYLLKFITLEDIVTKYDVILALAIRANAFLF